VKYPKRCSQAWGISVIFRSGQSLPGIAKEFHDDKAPHHPTPQNIPSLSGMSLFCVGFVVKGNLEEGALDFFAPAER